MAKLDDTSWHCGSDEFPEDLPEESGATHIGMFVAWAIGKGLWRSNATWDAALARVQVRQITGRDFLLEFSDGKFISDTLTPVGVSFAEAYYPQDYLVDYRRVLVRQLPSDYSVEDNWTNYDLIAAVIEYRWTKSRP